MNQNVFSSLLLWFPAAWFSHRLAFHVCACVVALVTASSQLAAQSVIAITPQQCVWKAGDDLHWTEPNLDERGWQPYTQWQSLPDVAHIWFRCRADLGRVHDTAHPAIQSKLEAAYQLFVNGTPVGGDGNIQSGFFGMNTIRQYPVPAAALDAQGDVIALRITTRQPLKFTPPMEIHAGDMDALGAQRASVVVAQISSALPVCFWYALIGVAGLMLLALFYYDRSRPELLWLCLLCMAKAALGIRGYCAAALMNYPWVLDSAVLAVVNVAAPAVSVMFYFALARRRVPRLYWLLIAVVSGEWCLIGVTLLLSPGQSVHLTILLSSLTVNLAVSVAALANSTAPFVAFWPYRQISRRMRPMATLCIVDGVYSIVWFGVQITGDPRLRLPDLWTHWERGLLEAGAFVSACVLCGLLALLFRDQRLVTEERALLAGEMHAASEIQHMLAPAKIDTAPGLKIDVAFHPIREVGGDFYLCRVLPDGRERVLVGDVSGKGAAAAMAAALLLGAAEHRDDDSPAQLLGHLNRVLRRTRIGGFATCLCADISTDGTVTIANAGHLAPYRRGKEIAAAPGLPLGISNAEQNEYAESRFELEAGDALTFLSDGVAEARNRAGELFGFDRTAAISTRSADEIAKAAEAFGQEDDVTVLTLTFTPVPLVHR